MNTFDTSKVVISEDLKDLPEIHGIGNASSLRTAMALDTSGALKSLVEQYAQTMNYEIREEILLDLIYRWTGVFDIDPASRASNSYYGNAIGDAQKLEAMERLFGEKFLGTWCSGGRDPNPHALAAKELLID